MLKTLAADAAARQNVKRNVNVETNLANKLIASTKKTSSTNQAFFETITKQIKICSTSCSYIRLNNKYKTLTSALIFYLMLLYFPPNCCCQAVIFFFETITKQIQL